MKCCLCKEEKPESEFVWRNAALGKRHEVCKECQREKSKKHYHANKQVYFDKKKEYIRETQSKMRQYKAAKGCVDCGETDHRCLDFDHIDPGTKVGNVATLARKWSYEKLLSEMEKCQVRCSNCHRKRTYDNM
jgi:L-lysine 2,3-aminomutase